MIDPDDHPGVEPPTNAELAEQIDEVRDAVNALARKLDGHVKERGRIEGSFVAWHKKTTETLGDFRRVLGNQGDEMRVIRSRSWTTESDIRHLKTSLPGVAEDVNTLADAVAAIEDRLQADAEGAAALMGRVSRLELRHLRPRRFWR